MKVASNLDQFKKVALKVFYDGIYSGTEEEYIGRGTITKRCDGRCLPLDLSFNIDQKQY